MPWLAMREKSMRNVDILIDETCVGEGSEGRIGLFDMGGRQKRRKEVVFPVVDFEEEGMKKWSSTNHWVQALVESVSQRFGPTTLPHPGYHNPRLNILIPDPLHRPPRPLLSWSRDCMRNDAVVVSADQPTSEVAGRVVEGRAGRNTGRGKGKLGWVWRA
ncbi:hypothetical protein J002_04529 [Cryptococcus neoformans]|nr:hypothetical protein J002_04529 [Cryptococcus neoformans var. grubii]